MRRLAILTTAVLIVCLAICTASLWILNDTLDEAHALNTEMFVLMETGDKVKTREKLVALATLWDERQAVLEVFCDHDDLHDVQEHIIQARICLDYTDSEDFFSAVSLIGEGLEHIREEEALTWSNLC